MARIENWNAELRTWLSPFLGKLGHKARRRMCPLYVAGLIGPGDRKSVQPMAERLRRATMISCTILSAPASGMQHRWRTNSLSKPTGLSVATMRCW